MSVTSNRTDRTDRAGSTPVSTPAPVGRDDVWARTVARTLKEAKAELDATPVIRFDKPTED